MATKDNHGSIPFTNLIIHTGVLVRMCLRLVVVVEVLDDALTH